jgi:hypothetical protein
MKFQNKIIGFDRQETYILEAVIRGSKGDIGYVLNHNDAKDIAKERMQTVNDMVENFSDLSGFKDVDEMLKYWN